MEKKYCIGNIVINIEYNEDLINTIEFMEKYLHYKFDYNSNNNVIANYYLSLRFGEPQNIIRKDDYIPASKEIVIYSDSKNRVKNIVNYFEYEDKDYFIGNYFSLKKYKSNIEMIISENNFNLERMPLRILRELLLRENENDKSTLFHGAFLTLLDHGILLTGNKGAGKTTLLCKLLEHMNSKFLSNDKLIIKRNLDVIYIPLSTRIALGTVSGNNKLIRKENYDLIKTDSKFAFTSYEIKNIFGCDLISNSSIDVIIIPNISENNKVNLTKLDKYTAKRLLIPSILTPKDVMWPNNWLVEKTNSDEEMSENSNFILNELLKKPCFILDYGFTTNSQELFDTIGGCFEKYRYKF